MIPKTDDDLLTLEVVLNRVSLTLWILSMGVFAAWSITSSP